MTKITKATIKSFIKKNEGKVYVMMKSRFDGMYDCVMETGVKEFSPATKESNMIEHTLGISGLWLVGGSRNTFFHYEDDNFIGYEVYNCCGTSVIAVQK